MARIYGRKTLLQKDHIDDNIIKERIGNRDPVDVMISPPADAGCAGFTGVKSEFCTLNPASKDESH